MTVRVLIKRKFPEGKTKDLHILINQLRVLSTAQPGYISGETLTRIDKPGESMVISKWKSVSTWDKWLHSKERAQIQEKIDRLLDEKTEYEIYDYD
ncbi:MAG TPA: antibiotic biosynthesis monooxygenase [Desulfobacterales bacterium]|nr:antibiotic biosynthesis monooxygenase [Desulfobacterales bacterium]